MSDQQMSVPIEAFTQALVEQRNDALDHAAQMKALAMHLKADNERLAAEVEKLRVDAGQ